MALNNRMEDLLVLQQDESVLEKGLPIIQGAMDFEPMALKSGLFKLYTPDDVEQEYAEAPDKVLLRTVMTWIRNFIMQSHPQLGRSGAVCPFVKPSINAGLTWLSVCPDTPSGSTLEIYQQLLFYGRLFSQLEPLQGELSKYRCLMVVLPQLAGMGEDLVAVLEPLHKTLKTRLMEQNILIGQFYPGCAVGSTYNPHFKPLQSPVPMFVLRTLIETDWRFLQGNPDWERLYHVRFQS